jgi:hypothetical protein
MWKIEIEPSLVEGDGCIYFAEPISLKPLAWVTQDFHRVTFSGCDMNEIYEAVMHHGVATGELTREDLRKCLGIGPDLPPGSENWGLKEWESYLAKSEAVMEEVKANPERFMVGPDGKTPYEREQK